MTSPLIQTAISACILTASSNIAAQLITAYRNDAPYTINWYPVLQFILFTALNSPPNFLWQQFLESTFPSQTVQPSSSAIAAAAQNDEKELDKEQSDHSIVESKLNIPNTITKFFLDQTIGATLNTLAFSFAMAAFQGPKLAAGSGDGKRGLLAVDECGMEALAVSKLGELYINQDSTHEIFGGGHGRCRMEHLLKSRCREEIEISLASKVLRVKTINDDMNLGHEIQAKGYGIENVEYYDSR